MGVSDIGKRLGRYGVGAGLIFRLMVSEPDMGEKPQDYNPSVYHDQIPDIEENMMGQEPLIISKKEVSIQDYVASLPVEAQERIFKRARKFSTVMEESFKGAVARVSPYAKIYSKAAKECGLPEKFPEALSIIETWGYYIYDPKVGWGPVSKERAKGPFQLMSETAKKHGLKNTWYEDESLDPEKSVYAALNEINELLMKYKYSFGNAFAAYNMGVGKMMKRLPNKSYWKANKKELPKETFDYAASVIGAFFVLSDPQAFGIDLNNMDGIDFAYYTVPKGADLKKISTTLGVSINGIKQFNPQMKALKEGMKLRYPAV